MNKDAWKYWYPHKEEIVEEDMPKLANLLKENGMSRILDLGCGTGRHTVYFAENGFDVYGFDFSEHAIHRVAERLKTKKLHADLKIWDMAKRFPYPEEFFDAVISTKVIHHATTATIEHIISEIDRISRPGGYFYMEAPTLERTPEYGSSTEKTKWIEPGTLVPTEGEEKGIPHHVFSQEEMLKLLGGHGFEVKEIHEIDGHIHVLAVKKQPRS